MTTTADARTPPGPPQRQALREFAALRRTPLDWVLERRARYGDTFRITPPVGLLGPEFTWACGPQGVRDVLTADSMVKDSPVYREMAGALGNGLLTSEGETWRAQRRTLQPLFTRKRVEGYGDAFARAASTVADGWSDGATVDLDAEMQMLSLRSVSVTLFGTDVTDQITPIVAATGLLSEATVRRGLSIAALPRWIPTPAHRRLEHAQHDLERRVDALIDQRRGATTDRDDLVSRLLEARDPETGTPLDDVEVREQALVFLLAGHDTTSTAMTFALHLLAGHPTIQDRVRSEVRDVVGGDAVTVEAVGQMDLVRRVVDEAMRLYPPAYITSRRATRPTTVDGFEIGEGGVVATSFWALHRNPDLWETPARFDPDRFLPERADGRDTYAYLPFGGGPRSCIGNHFALLEATIGVATIIGRWRLDSRTAAVPLNLGITLRPAAPVSAAVTAP